MSASRVLGLMMVCLMMVSSWLAAGCSSAKKIDVGGACILNSDCTDSLVCTMGKCHDGCHTTADCPAGESCITSSDQSTVCQLPSETHCSYNSDCQPGLTCGADQRCRSQCQTDVDCTPGQICTTTKTCAEPNQVDSNKNLIGTDAGVTGSGGASGADAAASCPMGAETCSCYPNDTCNAGLTCASHLCVNLGAGGSGGAGGTGPGAPDAAPGFQPDVPIGASGGSAGTGGTGGGGSDARMPDVAGAQPDVPIGASGGGVGTGGAGGSGSDAGMPDALTARPDVPVGGSGGSLSADGGTLEAAAIPDAGTGGDAGLCSNGQLAAYWTMDESTGPRADSSGHGLALQEHSGTITSVAGQFGRAAHLTGTAFFELPATAFNGSALDINTPPRVTIVSWVRFNGTVGGEILGVVRHCVASQYQYRVTSAGNIECSMGPSGSPAYILAGAVSADQWHHYAMVYDGATLTLYFDGVVTGTASWTTSALKPAGFGANIPLCVGGWQDVNNECLGGGDAFQITGDVDDVAVFSTALNVSQIAAIMAQGVGAQCGL